MRHETQDSSHLLSASAPPWNLCLVSTLLACVSPSSVPSQGSINTGVCVCVCVCESVAQLCLTLCDPMDCSPPGSSCPWDSPDKNTGVGSHSLLQGIFLTQ